MARPRVGIGSNSRGGRGGSLARKLNTERAASSCVFVTEGSPAMPRWMTSAAVLRICSSLWSALRSAVPGLRRPPSRPTARRSSFPL
jgi:hypothetical protein